MKQGSISLVPICICCTSMLPPFSRGGMDMMGSRSDVFSHMREVDGFPARSRDYDASGALINETTLVSSERRDVDPASFQPPAEYIQQQLPQ